MKYLCELNGGTHLVEMNDADFDFAARLGALRPSKTPKESLIAEPVESESASAPSIPPVQRPPAPRKKRTVAPRLPAGKVSVAPVIIEILRDHGCAMSVTSIADEFKRRTGTDHRKNVGVCLASLKNRFDRVDTGVYRLIAEKPRTAADIAAAARRVDEKDL